MSFFLQNTEQSQMYELVLGEVLDLQMNVSVTNKAESAYEAHLYIVYPESVTYIGGMTSRLEVRTQFLAFFFCLRILNL